MGTTSSVPKIKITLLERMKERVALANVQIEYAHPGANVEPELIFLGDVREGEHQIAAMKAGRKPRDETYTIDVYICVGTPNNSAAEAEARAFVLLAEIESVLADDPLLGLTPQDLNAAVGGSWELTNTVGDGTREAVIRYEVKCQARLS